MSLSQNFKGTFSANTLISDLYISGSTDLYDIFQTIGSDLPSTLIQNGLNTYTGGTTTALTINMSAATLDNLNVSGNTILGSVSATTFYGDGSQLSGISIDNFYTTGATLNNYSIFFDRTDLLSAYSVSLSGLAVGNTYENINFSTTLESIDANENPGCQWAYCIKDGINARFGNIFATWILSASSCVYTDYSTDDIGDTSSLVFNVSMNGNNAELDAYVASGNWTITLKRITGGLASGYTYVLLDSISVENLYVSGTTSLQTVSATTFFSGGTNLYNIFQKIGSDVENTRIQSGQNIITGGTADAPIISLVDSPIINNLTVSGNSVFYSLSANSLSASTFYGDGSEIVNVNLSTSIGQLPLSSYDGSFIKNKIIVGKSGLTNYTTIKAAMDSIVTNAFDNVWLIEVGPGIYIEDKIIVKPYVNIKGSSIFSTIIQPSGNHDLFEFKEGYSEISFVTIQNIQSGYTGVFFNDSGDWAQLHKVSFENCDTNVKVLSQTADTYVYLEYVDFNGAFNSGLKIESNNEKIAFCQVENYFQYPNWLNQMYSTNCNYISGAFAELNILGGTLLGTGIEKAVNIISGGTLFAENFLIKDMSYGIEVIDNGVVGGNGYIFNNCIIGLYDNITGSGGTYSVVGNFINCVENIKIENSGSTGYFNGVTEYTKTKINPLNSFFIYNKDLKIITVANRGGDFSSIASAINYITGSSESNIYKVLVGAGEFVEPLIDLSEKPYISIVGASIQTTIVKPDSASHNVFKIGKNNELSFLSIQNAGVGYAGVFVDDAGNFAQLHKVAFLDCDINVKVLSLTQDTVCYLEYVDFNGISTYGLYIEAANNFKSTVNAENFYTFPSASGFTAIYVEGIQSKLILNAAGIYGSDAPGTIAYGNIGIECQNGAEITLTATELSGFDTAIKNNNIGTGCTLNFDSITITNNDTYDINIQSPFTVGGMIGSAALSKVFINQTSTFTPFFTNKDVKGGVVVIGDIFQGAKQNELLNLSKMVISEASLGLSSGGEISVVSGRTISVSNGTGYLVATGNFTKEISWNTTQLTFVSGVTKYISVDENSLVSGDDSKPDGIHKILLGSVYTYGNYIHYLENTPVSINELGNRTIEFINDAFGVVFATGGIVSENGTRNLNVTGGERYYNLDSFVSSGGTPILFEEHWRNEDGTYRHGAFSDMTVRNDVYNCSFGLTAMTSGYYAKHSLYITGAGVKENYLFVFSQAEYSGETEAVLASLPTPPTEFVDSTCIIASIITQEGVANIIQIRDERPVIGFNSSSISSTLLHSNLQGLNSGNAGHNQFMMLNGTTPMVANLNVGNYNIISAGTINDVSIETHSSRHLPNGLDPLATGVPVKISNFNDLGVQNSFSKSDHKHAHGDHSGGTTHSVVTNSIDGFMSSFDKLYIDSLPNIFNTKANVSGQTFSGNIYAPAVSGDTFYSGGTLLENVITKIITATTQNSYIITISGDTTLIEFNQKVMVNSPSQININLPQITKDDVQINITNLNSGIETILPYSGQLINGDVEVVVARKYVSLDLISYNFNWYIV